jgi:hypothetical protein
VTIPESLARGFGWAINFEHRKDASFACLIGRFLVCYSTAILTGRIGA